MSAVEDNKKVVEKFITNVFNKHDFSLLDELMQDDYIQHNVDCPQRKSGFIQFFEQIFKAQPDFRYEIIRLVGDGDIVMAYCTSSGTHSGAEWLGAYPTGNRLNFNVVDIFRMQDGKIAEHWDVADTLTLFSQLGVVKRLPTNK